MDESGEQPKKDRQSKSFTAAMAMLLFAFIVSYDDRPLIPTTAFGWVSTVCFVLAILLVFRGVFQNRR